MSLVGGMMIRLELDKAMRELEKKRKALGGVPKTMLEIRKEFGTTMLSLVDEGFKTETAPSGRKWAPKKVPNGLPILQQTRLMRKSYFAYVRGMRTVLVNKAPYASFHQNGTVHMKARKTVPDGDALPPRWRGRLKKVAEGKLKLAFAEVGTVRL